MSSSRSTAASPAATGTATPCSTCSARTCCGRRSSSPRRDRGSRCGPCTATSPTRPHWSRRRSDGTSRGTWSTGCSPPSGGGRWASESTTSSPCGSGSSSGSHPCTGRRCTTPRNNARIRDELLATRRLFRDQFERQFAPELDELGAASRQDAVAAGDVLTQTDSIDLLRRYRQFTIAETEAVLRSGLSALLERR